jgi:hypothetical protein
MRRHRAGGADAAGPMGLVKSCEAIELVKERPLIPSAFSS